MVSMIKHLNGSVLEEHCTDGICYMLYRSIDNIDILFTFSNDFIILFAINTDHRFSQLLLFFV